jgi:hypothetical protein
MRPAFDRLLTSIRHRCDVRCTYCGTGLIFGRYRRQATFLPSVHGCRPSVRPRTLASTGLKRFFEPLRLYYVEAVLASCAGLIAYHCYLTYAQAAHHPIEPRTRSAAPAPHPSLAPTLVKLADKLPALDVAATGATHPEREFRPAPVRVQPRGTAQRLFVDAGPLDGASYARFSKAEGGSSEPASREVKPSPDQGRIAVAGLWGPTASACSTSAAQRQGMLPMVIDDRGARAGGVSCSFKDKTATGMNSWSVLAQCRNGQERWTSSVRLALSGSRLTWRSERGSQAYIRCERTLFASR